MKYHFRYLGSCVDCLTNCATTTCHFPLLFDQSHSIEINFPNLFVILKTKKIKWRRDFESNTYPLIFLLVVLQLELMSLSKKLFFLGHVCDGKKLERLPFPNFSTPCIIFASEVPFQVNLGLPSFNANIRSGPNVIKLFCP